MCYLDAERERGRGQGDMDYAAGTVHRGLGLLLREKKPAGKPMPESLLARLWSKRAARQAEFRTGNGTRFRVLYPGHPGGGSGPRLPRCAAPDGWRWSGPGRRGNPPEPERLAEPRPRERPQLQRRSPARPPWKWSRPPPNCKAAGKPLLSL